MQVPNPAEMPSVLECIGYAAVVVAAIVAYPYFQLPHRRGMRR
jgi:hypothetical protein